MFGKWQGRGKRYASDGRLIYEGEFHNDLYHGKGKLFGENGAYYDGEWKNGLKHGFGVNVKQNGKSMLVVGKTETMMGMANFLIREGN